MKKTIIKSINVDAPKMIVWDVLTNDSFTRIWYAAFSDGSHAITDNWQEGSTVLFVDDTQSGLIAKVVQNKRGEVLSVEHVGQVVDGKEDYESPVAQALKGGLETYRLKEVDGQTKLTIECDMDQTMFESMSALWDKALEKLQSLAEGIGQSQVN
jgi:hypothetical protein